MHREQLGPFNIEATLDWGDLEVLETGGCVGDRYNGEHKLLIYRSYPCDVLDGQSRMDSLRQKEVARLDRRTMDIEVYIPQGVLRHSIIRASNFGNTEKNLTIYPRSKDSSLKNMHVRVVYP